jgi:hypothetical protein
MLPKEPHEGDKKILQQAMEYKTQTLSVQEQAVQPNPA